MDVLQEGARWLEEQRLQFMTRKVLYQRGTSSVEVNATIGKTIFTLDNGFGVREQYEARDYLVAAAELVLDDNLTLPKRGDRLRETSGTTVFVYEVMAPGKEPEFRFSDLYRYSLRIHTKLVGTEAI
jgi:hypothetical protein